MNFTYNKDQVIELPTHKIFNMVIRGEKCEVCGEDNWTCHDYRDSDGNGEIYFYCQGLINDLEYCDNMERFNVDVNDNLADELYDAYRDNRE